MYKTTHRGSIAGGRRLHRTRATALSNTTHCLTTASLQSLSPGRLTWPLVPFVTISFRSSHTGGVFVAFTNVLARRGSSPESLLKGKRFKRSICMGARRMFHDWITLLNSVGVFHSAVVAISGAGLARHRERRGLLGIYLFSHNTPQHAGQEKWHTTNCIPNKNIYHCMTGIFKLRKL